MIDGGSLRLKLRMHQISPKLKRIRDGRAGNICFDWQALATSTFPERVGHSTERSGGMTNDAPRGNDS